MEKTGFTVIEGGKGNNPGATHTHTANQGASHDLPPGFTRTEGKSLAGGIPCRNESGEEGELIEIPGNIPPHILLLMLLAMSAKANSRNN